MALKSLVKATTISNLHDVRYCAGMGVHLIGICLDAKQPSFMPLDKFKEISGWVDGVQFVGEIHDQAPSNLQEYGVHFLQTNVPSAAEFLKHYHLPLILRIEISSPEDLTFFASRYSAYLPDYQYFLIESSSPSLLPNHQLLAALAQDFPLVVGYGISGENVNALLEEVKPAGIAVYGSEEIKTGINNFDLISEILEAIEEEN